MKYIFVLMLCILFASQELFAAGKRKRDENDNVLDSLTKTVAIYVWPDGGDDRPNYNPAFVGFFLKNGVRDNEVDSSERGAKICLQSDKDIRLLLDADFAIDQGDHEGNTLLHSMLTWRNRWLTASLLLNYPSRKNKYGRMPYETGLLRTWKDGLSFSIASRDYFQSTFSALDREALVIRDAVLLEQKEKQFRRVIDKHLSVCSVVDLVWGFVGSDTPSDFVSLKECNQFIQGAGQSERFPMFRKALEYHERQCLTVNLQ